MAKRHNWESRVLALMVAETDEYGVYCGSQAGTAAILKTSKRSVNEAIKNLEKQGAVTQVSRACYKVLSQVVPNGTTSLVPNGTTSSEESSETRTSIDDQLVPNGTTSVVPNGTTCESTLSSGASDEEKQRIKEELDKFLIANGLKRERGASEAKPVAEAIAEAAEQSDTPPPTPPSPGNNIYIYNTPVLENNNISPREGEEGSGEEGGSHKFSDRCPGGVTQETWDEYMRARDETPKAKQTERAITMLVKKIERYELLGSEPEAMVRRSIEGNGDRCWTTVYPTSRSEKPVAGSSLSALGDGLAGAVLAVSRGILPSPKQEEMIVGLQKQIGFKPKQGETWQEIGQRLISELDDRQGKLL